MQSVNQIWTDVGTFFSPIIKYLLKGHNKWRKGFSSLHIHTYTYLEHLDNVTFPFLSAPHCEKGCPHSQRTIASNAICINVRHFSSIKKWNSNLPVCSL